MQVHLVIDKETKGEDKDGDDHNPQAGFMAASRFGCPRF